MSKSNKKVHKIATRRVHMDFHTPDAAENVGGNLNAEHFAEVLAAAEVEQAAFFAKCHYGNSYYPTKIGRVHPNLKCDMLGEFTAAAAKRGILTFAYYSLQFDWHYGNEHPDCMQDPRPFVIPNTGHWKATCINGPYGEFALAQLLEVVRNYDVAGLWIDIAGYYPFCVCPRCRERYMKETGKPLPFDDNKPKEGIGVEFEIWQRNMLDRYTERIVKEVRKIRSDCDVLYNTATGIPEKASGWTNQADQQWCEEGTGCSPHMLAMLGYYTGLFDSALKRRPFEICTQRFKQGWGDWTLRQEEALKFDTATIVAHGGVVSIGDQLYGDGSHEPAVYERIGDVYRWLKPRQEFSAGSVDAAEVAVFAAPPHHLNDPGAILYNSGLCACGEGLFKAMMDSNCPVAVLSTLDSLASGQYRVVIVDDHLSDTDKSAAAMKKFIDGGGCVLAVGMPPKRYWKMFGIENAKPLPYSVSYICMNDDLLDGPEPMPTLARIQGHSVTLAKGAKTLGRWAYPLFERTEKTFFSHQHAPAGKITNDPAVWRAGNVIGIATPIAADYWNTSYVPLRKIILACLNELLDRRRQIYATNLPATCEVTLRKRDNSLFVHLIDANICRPVGSTRVTFYIDEPTEIHKAKLSVRLPAGKKCTAASQLGKKLTVEPGPQKGYVSVTLKPFATHTIVKLDMK